MGLFDWFRQLIGKQAGDQTRWWAPVAAGYGKAPLTPAEVQQMVQAGQDVNARDENGNTLLHKAAAADSVEIMRILLGHGADVNARNERGSTPLHRAASGNRLNAACCLILAGADVDLTNAGGETPAECEDNDTCSLLAAAKDPNAPTGYAGEPPLVTAASREQMQVCKALLLLGADANATDEDGNTALHNAAYNDDAKMIQLLLGKGANVNARTEDGDTPLHVAALADNAASARALIAAGADVNAVDGNQCTPLHTACGCQARDVAKLLLANGADLEATDSEGKTALQIARQYSPGVADLIKAKAAPPSEDEVNMQRKMYGQCPKCQGALEPRKRNIEVALDASGGQMTRQVRVTDLYCAACERVIKKDHFGDEEQTRQEMRNHFGL